MMVIDGSKYPRLHCVAQEAVWLGSEESCPREEVAAVYEKWLDFFAVTGGLARAHYLGRLRGPKEQCVTMLAEIAVAHFFVTECGMSIFEWEPRGAEPTPGEPKHGDFLMGRSVDQSIFVEVKSPRWQGVVAKAEGNDSPRLLEPKYRDEIETRCVELPQASVTNAIASAYSQLPGTTPTMLVIADDLWLPLAVWAELLLDIGLDAKGGPFVDRRYELLGAVGLFKTELSAQVVGYRFVLFENPHALPEVVVPRDLADRYRHTPLSAAGLSLETLRHLCHPPHPGPGSMSDELDGTFVAELLEALGGREPMPGKIESFERSWRQRHGK